ATEDASMARSIRDASMKAWSSTAESSTQEIDHFLTRYRLIVDIPYPLLNHQSKRLHVDRHAKCIRSFDEKREAELAIVKRKYLKSDFYRCLLKLHLVNKDPIYDEEDSSSQGSSSVDFDSFDEQPLDIHAVKVALGHCTIEGLNNFAYSGITSAALNCYRMLTNDRTRNCVIDPDTTELEYRSRVIDFIFTQLLEDRWFHYLSGEQHNSLMATDRVIQQLDETARGPLHDGIGCAVFDNLKVPLLLVEVVGWPTMRDAAKERTDCEKLLKGLATTLSVQAEMASGDEVVLDKMRAVGLLVYQRRVKIMEARYVDDYMAVKMVDDVMIPGSVQHWCELGRLMERLVYIKVCCAVLHSEKHIVIFLTFRSICCIAHTRLSNLTSSSTYCCRRP
ncbi:hypothetical protein HK097_010517, partial [Rhizophlyctis rosea]